ncbi:MAG: hypothetical protein Q9174_001643 [Haloplaca sp. 1 TL-2023]
MSVPDNCLVINNFAVPWHDLALFTIGTHKRRFSDRELLLICWKSNFPKYKNMTTEDAAYIKEYINDPTRREYDEQVRRYYDEYYSLTYGADNSSLVALHRKTALSEAKDVDFALLNHLGKKDLWTLIVGRMWTDLEDVQISQVLAFKKFMKELHRRKFSLLPHMHTRKSLEDQLPLSFRGRESTLSELPTRALEWTKRYRPKEYQRCIRLSTAEKEEWKEMAEGMLTIGTVEMSSVRKRSSCFV